MAKESVLNYFVNLVRTPDGIAVIGCSVISIIIFIFGVVHIPEIHFEKSSKQLVILAFTPIIILFSLIRLRQLPFSEKKWADIFRLIIIIVIFFILNF